jgi:hypothetical protein
MGDLHRRAAVRPSIGPVLDHAGDTTERRRLAAGLTTIETTPGFGSDLLPF